MKKAWLILFLFINIYPRMKEHYNYLIIGADAAGNTAAGQIRRQDKEASIGILEKGEYIAYGACGLPYVIEKKIESVDKLVHFTAEKFGKQLNADVLIFHEAVFLNAKEKKVKVKILKENIEKEISYDKLMVASGASPIRLPFIDYANDRIFELKTINDGKKITAFIETTKPKTAAIIGSGYIGLECAEAFHENGIQVKIFEALDLPMPRMPIGIREDIKKNLETNNIEFINNSPVEKVEVQDKEVIITSAGKTYAVDFLLSAIGVRPQTDFLDNSGIQTQNKAVIVDAFGKTSHPDVYAAGDCALVWHNLLQKPVYFPLGHTANKTGRIAGLNMAGQKIEFNGITGTQAFKFFDTVYAQTGLSEAEAIEAGFDTVEISSMSMSKAGYYPEAEKIKMRLLLKKKTGQILGASLAGPLDSYGLIDTASSLIYYKAKAHEIAWMDFIYAPPFAPVWNALVSAAGKFSE